MEVQNISGTDIISSGFSSNIRINNENTKTAEKPETEIKKEPDESKGQNIDITA